MNIGTVAEKSGVSPKTIRYYESIGLIRRPDRRTNGYRMYTETDVQGLKFVKRARHLGFSVEEVRELLDLWRDRRRTNATVRALIERHSAAMDHKLAELISVRRGLTVLLERYPGDDGPECPIIEDLSNGQ